MMSFISSRRRQLALLKPSVDQLWCWSSTVTSALLAVVAQSSTMQWLCSRRQALKGGGIVADHHQVGRQVGGRHQPHAPQQQRQLVHHVGLAAGLQGSRPVL